MFRMSRTFLFNGKGEKIDWRKEAQDCYDKLLAEKEQLNQESTILEKEISERQAKLLGNKSRLFEIEKGIERVANARAKLSADDRQYHNYDLENKVEGAVSDILENDYKTFQDAINSSFRPK